MNEIFYRMIATVRLMKEKINIPSKEQVDAEIEKIRAEEAAKKKENEKHGS